MKLTFYCSSLVLSIIAQPWLFSLKKVAYFCPAVVAQWSLCIAGCWVEGQGSVHRLTVCARHVLVPMITAADGGWACDMRQCQECLS